MQPQQPTNSLSLPRELRQQILLLSHEYDSIESDVTKMRDDTWFFKEYKANASLELTKALKQVDFRLIEDADYVANKVQEQNDALMTACEARREAVLKDDGGFRLSRAWLHWHGWTTKDGVSYSSSDGTCNYRIQPR